MLVILVSKNKDYAGCVTSSDITLIPNLAKNLSVGVQYFSGEGDGRMDTGVRTLSELMIT
jgi:hypothetical protein